LRWNNIRTELGIEPMAETRGLAAEIAGDHAPLPPSPELTAALIHQRDAMIVLRRHLIHALRLIDQSLAVPHSEAASGS
jgi:hypothetical protein